MAEKTKNLCAQIPESLHAKVRERQEASGQSLSQYMTELITKFYEMEGRPMAKENQRTVAFQVDVELFQRFKEYLKARGIKQNAFFLDCIRRALAEAGQAGEEKTIDNRQRRPYNRHRKGVVLNGQPLTLATKKLAARVEAGRSTRFWG